MICDRFETVVIPFPFAEIPVLKRRPVVVVSAIAHNEANGWTLVSMITSTKLVEWPSDVRIADLGPAGLQVPCIVRWRLTSIPNGMIVRRLGKIAGIDRLACERSFAAMILD